MADIWRKWALYDYSVALGSCLIAIPIMFYTGGEFIVGFGVGIGLTFSLMGIGRFLKICE